MADKKTGINAKIGSVNRTSSDELNYKSHSEDGVHFLTDANPAPTGNYYGFYVIADTVVASITYIDSSKQTGDLTAVTSFLAGAYITLPGLFSTITLTSGEIQLFKKSH